MLNAAHDTFLTQLTQAGLKIRNATKAQLTEPRGKFTGAPAPLATPKTTQDLATIVKAANAHRVGLIPHGGGTGLVGGQTQPTGPTPLIVSLSKMIGIRSLNTTENTAIAEAGTPLAQLQAAATDQNRLFPLSYASQGSATIGGALAVNSGGLNVLRYGTARDLCLGLEAVLPNGDIFHGLKRLRKDNTGYDLRNLLIGAEGTLGIITAASLKLFPQPQSQATAFLAVPNPKAALELLTLFQTQTGNAVSAFELISGQSFAFLGETQPNLRQPFAAAPDWAVLVEIGTESGAEQQMEATFQTAFNQGLTTDGLIAQSGQQRAQFWTLRETIPEANRAIGAIASHDISLPLTEIPEFLDAMEAALHAHLPCRINAFGHLGDGNLHYNVFPPKGESKTASADLADDITRLVHDRTVAMGGSFSAEHGVGRLKTADLNRYADPAKLTAMRAIKTALDPNGILNPGAVLG